MVQNHNRLIVDENTSPNVAINNTAENSESVNISQNQNDVNSNASPRNASLERRLLASPEEIARRKPRANKRRNVDRLEAIRNEQGRLIKLQMTIQNVILENEQINKNIKMNLLKESEENAETAKIKRQCAELELAIMKRNSDQ